MIYLTVVFGIGGSVHVISGPLLKIIRVDSILPILIDGILFDIVAAYSIEILVTVLHDIYYLFSPCYN